MDNTNITPQGYTYAIEPNTIHPFWKSGGDSNYIYADLKNPVIFENTDRNFTRFDAVLQGAVEFIAPLTLALVSVTINSEVALPFVGVMHGDIAFLICEGIETNRLKVVGVYASSDMSDLEIKNIISIPAPIKGDQGEDGQDGVTPVITSTATVDQTTGVANVTVSKSGPDTQPAFNFAFTGLKGERGERGQDGANGNDGATGATPDITINATVDETTGTPAVDVTKSGTHENPVFDLAFSGLKGEGGGKQIIPILDTLTSGGLKAGDIVIFDGGEFDIPVSQDIICTNTYFMASNTTTSTYITRTMKAFNCQMGVILQDVTGYKAEIPLSLVMGESHTYKFTRDMYMEYNATAGNISISSQVHSRGSIASVDGFSESDQYFRILCVGGFELLFNNTSQQTDFLNHVKVIR